MPIPAGKSLFYFDHSTYDGVDIFQRMTIFKAETLKSHVPRAGTKHLTPSLREDRGRIVVLHDKSEIGGGLLPIVAKPEGEVICTYPPSKQSELFYTDLGKQAAQGRKGRALSPPAQGAPRICVRACRGPRPAAALAVVEGDQ